MSKQFKDGSLLLCNSCGSYIPHFIRIHRMKESIKILMEICWLLSSYIQTTKNQNSNPQWRKAAVKFLASMQLYLIIWCTLKWSLYCRFPHWGNDRSCIIWYSLCIVCVWHSLDQWCIRKLSNNTTADKIGVYSSQNILAGGHFLKKS